MNFRHLTPEEQTDIIARHAKQAEADMLANALNAAKAQAHADATADAGRKAELEAEAERHREAADRCAIDLEAVEAVKADRGKLNRPPKP